MSDTEAGEYKSTKSPVKQSRSRSRSRSADSDSSRGSKKSRSLRRSYSRSRSRSYRSRSRSGSRRRYRSRNSGSPRRRYYSRSSRSRSYSRGRHGSKSPMSGRKRHIGDRLNPPSGKCLGVFGLSLYTNDSDLRSVFSRYGRIADINVVIDQKTGRSRGFGFVYFDNDDDAAEAKDRANGMELDGRNIRVDYSITKRAHTPTPGVYVGRPYAKPRDGDRYESRDRYDRGGDRHDRHYERDRHDRGRYESRDRYRDDYRDRRDSYRRSPSPGYRRRSPSPYYRDRSPRDRYY
ncbi:transformer-2 protein homolog beta-like isoform X3 [Ciona intestinalis]